MDMKSFEQVALQLYGLADHDQQWILDRLENDEARTRILRILQELERRQVPRDDRVIADIVRDINVNLQKEAGFTEPEQQPARPADKNPGREAIDRIRRINNMPVRKIINVLGDEPEWIIRTVVCHYNWTWKDAVVRRFGLAPKKNRRGRDNCAPVTAPLVRDKVIELFFRKVETGSLELPEENNTSGGSFDTALHVQRQKLDKPSWWKRLWKK